MGCKNKGLVNDLELNCEDIPVGGLTAVYLVRYSDAEGKLTVTDGVVTDSTIAAGKIVKLDFNNKDGKTSFTDVKTVSETGVVKSIPTVIIEFPKMTLAKRNAVEKITSPNTEYVAFVEEATGVRHAIGMDFGVWGSGVEGATGASKDDKNAYTLTLLGDETNLSETINKATWDKIVAALKP